MSISSRQYGGIPTPPLAKGYLTPITTLETRTRTASPSRTSQVLSDNICQVKKSRLPTVGRSTPVPDQFGPEERSWASHTDNLDPTFLLKSFTTDIKTILLPDLEAVPASNQWVPGVTHGGREAGGYSHTLYSFPQSQPP